MNVIGRRWAVESGPVEARLPAESGSEDPQATGSGGRDASEVPADLRALLICPIDHGDLDDGPSTLICRVCQRRYPVTNGVPDLRI